MKDLVNWSSTDLTRFDRLVLNRLPFFETVPLVDTFIFVDRHKENTFPEEVG
jgi:hypothetical protein